MITLTKLKKEKKTLTGLKGILITIIVLFFITLVLWFLIMNFKYMGAEPKPADTFYFIIIGIPFSFLVLAGVFFVLLRLFTVKYVSHYLYYIKTTFFNNAKVKRTYFTKLLGVHDENLRHLGFNYTVKEFTYDNFIHAFKSLKKKEKLHQLIRLVGIDDVLQGSGGL